MTFATMQHIPLMSAYLCQDCNCVGNSSKQCPACASEVLLSLSGILNREPDVKVDFQYIQKIEMPAFAA